MNNISEIVNLSGEDFAKWARIVLNKIVEEAKKERRKNETNNR